MNHTRTVRGSALLLAPREDLAAVDRRALRDAGFRTIRMMFSGVEAAGLLAATTNTPRTGNEHFVPDIVLCNEQIADMSGDEFVRLVRLHPGLLELPIVVTASADTEDVRRRALESGYSGLLVRPYPQTRLLEELDQACRNRDATRLAIRGRERGSDAAFREALAAREEAARAMARNSNHQFREGLVLLRRQQWDEGIALLQRSLEENPAHGDALLALGAAWRGKGNETKYRAMLREAVAVFVEQEAWEKARATGQRLIREHAASPNPLLEEAGRLLLRNDFENAAHALVLARDIAPCPDMYERLFRACTRCMDTPKAVLELPRALLALGEEAFAREARTQLLNRLEALAPEAARDPVFREPLGDSPSPTPGVSSKEPVPFAEAFGPGSSAVPVVLPLDAAPAPAGAGSRKNAEDRFEPSSSVFPGAVPTLRDVWTVARITMGLFRRLK